MLPVTDALVLHEKKLEQLAFVNVSPNVLDVLNLALRDQPSRAADGRESIPL